MSIVTAWLIAALFQSAPLHPSSAPQQSAAAETQIPRFEKLSSGLRLCVIEDHALPLVSVQLWFKVGSSFDPPTQRFTRVRLPSADAAVRQILGRRGEVWGAESGADKLVVVRTR